MATAYNSKLVTDNLVLCLDAANPKSYPGTGNNWFNLLKGNRSETISGETTTNLMYSSGTFVGSIGTLTGSFSVTTVEANSKYRVQCNTSGLIRISIPNGLLVNNQTYTLSYKYKVISGLTNFLINDFCDVNVGDRLIIDTGDYIFASATAKRITYDSTFRFFDTPTFQVGDIIDIWDIQVEQKPYPTVFVNGIRSSATSNQILTGGNQNSDLINGPSYQSQGVIVFDGVDDYVKQNPMAFKSGSGWTLSCWISPVFNSTKIGASVFYAVEGNYLGYPCSVPLTTQTDTTYITPKSSIGSTFYICSNYVTNFVGSERIPKIFKMNSIFTAVDQGFNTGSVGYLSTPVHITASTYYSGKIYVCENLSQYSKYGKIGFKRYNSDGSLDTGFGTSTSGFNFSTAFSAEDSSGNIYVVGSFTSYNGTAANRIIKLNTDGSIDTSFVYGTGFNNVVTAIYIDPINGGIYVIGNFTSYNGTAANRIIKLNTDGSIDTSFVYGTGFNGQVLCIEFDENGDLYVGGGFTTYNGTAVNRMVKLTSTGSIDASFVYGTGFNGAVRSISYSYDFSWLYVGGAFTTYNGTAANRIITLNTDGSIETSFVYGTGFDGAVLSILADSSSGFLYVGGSFTTYQGSAVSSFVGLDIYDGTFVTDIFGLTSDFESCVNLSTNFYNIRYLDGFVFAWVNKTPVDLTIIGASQTILTANELYDIFDGNTTINLVESMDTNSTYKAYLNGQLVCEIPNVENSGILLYNLFNDISTSSKFQGKASNISVYSKALSATEIQQNFNATRSRYGI